MSISDIDQVESQLDQVVDSFEDLMKRLFDEEPEIFSGRSSKMDWTAQVDAAGDELRKELNELIEKHEVKLHNGDYY